LGRDHFSGGDYLHLDVQVLRHSGDSLSVSRPTAVSS